MNSGSEAVLFTVSSMKARFFEIPRAFHDSVLFVFHDEI